MNTQVIKLKNITARVFDQFILKNTSWELRKNENWLIIGPNGSGKSTLLSLISADNLLAYSNNIYLFGHKRGSEETIFDICDQIAINTNTR
jgi:molybdate transport system ATP-binding protein